MISGGDSAATAEADLRSLAASVLQPVLGDEWIARSGALLPKALTKAGQRRDEEVATRPGAERDIVFYLELSDIITITLNKWQYFKKALGPSRERWTQESHVLRTLRNTQAHGRQLVEFEEDLLRGIAGDIRNRVTRFRSEVDPQENWWPRIESVHDSFGNSYTSDLEKSLLLHLLSTGLVLNVGDEVSFSCAGWDPQGRELSWRLVSAAKTRASAIGTNVELRTTVGKGDIAKILYFVLELTAKADYHRDVGHDDEVTFTYLVRPPHAS